MRTDLWPWPARLFKTWMPPRLRHLLIAALVDRFSPAALHRFQQAHRAQTPIDRDDLSHVAVILPCYNHGEYLEATLESLARQTYRPFEVVAVDDRSIDETWPHLQRWLPELPAGIQPRLLQTPSNSGQAGAINYGVSASPATVFMILNDDDYLVHDALEAALDLLGRNAELFLLGASCVPFAGQAKPSPDDPSLTIHRHHPDYATVPLTRYRPEAIMQLRQLHPFNMTHSGLSFCRSAWQAVGGYYSDKARRVAAYSDRDFQLRVASLFPVAVAHSVPFAFWRSDSSVDRGRNT